jgi:predicted aldo/keto reductase-like oxidoreductase
MYQHPSDWHNDTGVIRQAKEQNMGVILMRPLTSGVFQRLMAEAFPEIDVLDVGRLLLNYVLSDPYVDVALVGMRPAPARYAVCGAEQRDLGRCRVAD